MTTTSVATPNSASDARASKENWNRGVSKTDAAVISPALSQLCRHWKTDDWI